MHNLIDQQNCFSAIDNLIKSENKPFSIETIEDLFNSIEYFLTKRENNKTKTFNNITWDDVVVFLPIEKASQARELCQRTEEFVVDKPNHPFSNIFRTRDLFLLGVNKQILDILRDYQDSKQISGLIRKTFEARGKTVDYWTRSCYFRYQSQDRKILASQVEPITEKFLSLAKQENPKYSLSRLEYVLTKKEVFPTSYPQIKKSMQQATSAWIGQFTTEWRRETLSADGGNTFKEYWTGSYVNHPQEPDMIELHLTLDWKDFSRDNANRIATFRLSHPHRQPPKD